MTGTGTRSLLQLTTKLCKSRYCTHAPCIIAVSGNLYTFRIGDRNYISLQVLVEVVCVSFIYHAAYLIFRIVHIIHSVVHIPDQLRSFQHIIMLCSIDRLAGSDSLRVI